MHYMSPHLTRKFPGHFVVPVTCLQLVLPRVLRNIVQSFTDPSGNLRLLIATTAFGMGIDSPNICHIVHWTPPESVEMYVQQSGRGGRDGERTVAVIYYNEGDLTNNVTGEMAAYCVNRDRKC